MKTEKYTSFMAEINDSLSTEGVKTNFSIRNIHVALAVLDRFVSQQRYECIGKLIYRPYNTNSPETIYSFTANPNFEIRGNSHTIIRSENGCFECYGDATQNNRAEIEIAVTQTLRLCSPDANLHSEVKQAICKKHTLVKWCSIETYFDGALAGIYAESIADF